MPHPARYLLDDEAVLQRASEILHERMVRDGDLSDPTRAIAYLAARIGGAPREEFHVIFLDSRHRVIATETLFAGSVSQADVHPREVVRRALHHNASALILSHNHPSGLPQASASDLAITAQLKAALALIDVRILDHIIVAGDKAESLAAGGLL